MTGHIANQIPYLRVQRTFPEEAQPLSVELDKTYIDVANAVNQRTIGSFASTLSYATGEQWYLSPIDRRLQGYRLVVPITGAGSYPHGITTSNVIAFVRLWGVFTNGTNWYPLPYVDVTGANNQVSLSLTPTNVVVTSGAGAPPAITSGNVVVEWIA